MSFRVSALAALALVVPAGVTATRAQAAHKPAPYLSGLRCVPATAKGCGTEARARIGGQVQLRGNRLYSGMRVTFRWSTGALATTLQHKRSGWIAKVPVGTAPGKVAVTVRDRARRRSNARHVRVTVALLPTPKNVVAGNGELPLAFRGNGMWIWELPKSERGDVAAIAAKAHATGIATVFVKSADGAKVWSQFTPQLVAELHALGLKVCAWQYVYGSNPSGEAAAAATAAAKGADCFVIDAESEYQGRYGAAQTYINALRAAVGEAYPIGLSSFPYVHYHPRLPYSVFLGPGGAQANLPQVYWKTIGTTVQTASARTMMHNRIYGTALAPLGQAYSAPATTDLTAFRQIWASYGAKGLSWWSWQASSAATWTTLAEPDPVPGLIADAGWPALALKSKGDQVIWLQQHLASFDPAVPIDGTFGVSTQAAVRALQAARGLPVTGGTDAATWKALLELPLQAVDWTGASARSAAAVRRSGP
ncbi:MAG TPA: peptidoglycan-binding domain-containing protein [Solirubrobacteraceae bacterium]|nr:peptidoglycan-binding domain-containing protein [Solirubrobacteraceae bacterium]